jgi:hypothetical protein
MITRKRLHSQMNPLVPLQVVIPVEALRTLIALERPVVGAGLLVRRVAQEVRHARCVAAVEARHHARVYTHER